MELYVGVIGIIGVVFVVIFGGRGLIDLVRGVIERRRLQGTQVTTEPSAPAPVQEIRFTTTADAVRIAYAVTGEGPPVFAIGGALTHVEAAWTSPIWRHWWDALSRGHTLVRYDQRDRGLSDREPAELSLRTLVLDLEAVVDAVDQGPHALVGLSRVGGAIAVEYAAIHPERVTHLVLYGAQARSLRARGTPDVQRAAMNRLLGEGWGRDDAPQRQLLNALLVRWIPEANPEQLQAMHDIARVTLSPGGMGRTSQAMTKVDLRPSAGRVLAPTLVLHSRGDGFIPFDHGRELASLIPRARFVALQSKNHILLADEPAFAELVSEVGRFLATPAAPAAGEEGSSIG